MKQLTWREVSTLKFGARVQFVDAWDIFPITVVNVGTAGTLLENFLTADEGANAIAFVLPDDQALRRDLAEWDGAIQLSPFWGGTAASEDEEWDALSPIALSEEVMPCAD